MAIGPGEPTLSFTAAGITFAPAQSGVYAICNAQGLYVYFGESDNIQQQLREHLQDAEHQMHAHGASLFAYELIVDADGRVARRSQLIEMFPATCNPPPQ